MIRVIVSFLPLAVCAFWSIALALNIREKGNLAAHRLLLQWAISATLLYTGHFVFFNHIAQVIPVSDTIYVICNLLVYPLYLQYITVLTQGSIKCSRQWLVWSPSAVFGSAVAVIYMLMSDHDCSRFADTYLYHNSIKGLTGPAMAQAVVHNLAKVCFAVGVVWVLVVGIRRIRQYNRLIDSIYADNDGKRLFGITTILLLMLFTGVLSFTVNIIGRFTFINATIPLALLACFFSVLLYMLCYRGFVQQFSFVDIAREESEEAVEDDPVVELPQAVMSTLLQRIDSERLYLQQGLTLADLAKQLGTNRTTLSKLINEQAGMSFAEFINRKRIAYVITLEQADPKALKQDLAEQAGYASMRSFYRNYQLYCSSTSPIPALKLCEKSLASNTAAKKSTGAQE